MHQDVGTGLERPPGLALTLGVHANR
jgi:hypothetical protein